MALVPTPTPTALVLAKAASIVRLFREEGGTSWEVEGGWREDGVEL